jgi:hypothetical protein
MEENYLQKNNLMKSLGVKFLGLITLSLVFFFSCTNQYEKQAIGYYEVESYERKDSSKNDKIDLPMSLTLDGDKTFFLVFKNTTSNPHCSFLSVFC